MRTKSPSLPFLDEDHPFYSDKADKEWEARRKKAEEEEKEMIKENRRRYDATSKKQDS